MHSPAVADHKRADLKGPAHIRHTRYAIPVANTEEENGPIVVCLSVGDAAGDKLCGAGGKLQRFVKLSRRGVGEIDYLNLRHSSRFGSGRPSRVLGYLRACIVSRRFALER